MKLLISKLGCITAYVACCMLAYVEPAAAETVSERSLSALGRDLLGEESVQWHKSSVAGNAVYAPTSNMFVSVHRQLRFTSRKLDYFLGEDPVVGSNIVMIDSPGLWERTVHKWGRHDSVALTVGDDIFVLQQNPSASYWPRLIHEMVHLRVRRLYDGRTPLWLDEGLAGFIGWEITKDYCNLLGKRPVRNVPSTDAMPLEELMNMTSYPDDPATARAYYRQSEEFLSQISSRIGEFRLADFVKAMDQGKDTWRDVLKKQFKLTEGELVEIESEWIQEVERGGTF